MASNKKPNLFKTEKTFKWYIGGLAGSVASTATHPLDLLKVRLQVSKAFFKETTNLKNNKNSLNVIVKRIFKNEGIIGFYRGLSSSVMRQLTYSSLRFNIYYVLKKKIIQRSKNKTINFLPQTLCACISGIAGATAGNVFDLLNIRMQSNGGLPKNYQRSYKNAFKGLWTLLYKEGFSACFVGLPTNMQRAVIITIAQIVSYERAKSFLNKKGFGNHIGTHFLASLISGLITVTVSNPVDVIKSVIMSSPKGKYKSGLSCAKNILMKNGPLYFMKGWTPSYVRLAPHTVITFVVLEQMKKLTFFHKRN